MHTAHLPLVLAGHGRSRGSVGKEACSIWQRWPARYLQCTILNTTISCDLDQGLSHVLSTLLGSPCALLASSFHIKQFDIPST